MTNPVLDRLRHDLRAGAERAEHEAEQARARLLAAGGVGQNTLLRLQLDRAGGLVEVAFTPEVLDTTAPRFAAGVQAAYTEALADFEPLPETPAPAPSTVPVRTRPASASVDTVALATARIEWQLTGESEGVTVTLNGQGLLMSAGATAAALTAGQEPLALAFTTAWALAVEQIDARVAAALNEGSTR